MGNAEPDIIFSDDYTRIAQHDSKSWTIKDISLAPIGGASWVAARSAARRSALVWIPAMVIPLGVVLLIIGWNPFIALFTLPFPFVLLYHRASGDRKKGLNEPERRTLQANARRQPTRLLGLRQDTEPSEFDWPVILFRIAGPGEQG